MGVPHKRLSRHTRVPALVHIVSFLKNDEVSSTLQDHIEYGLPFDGASQPIH